MGREKRKVGFTQGIKHPGAVGWFPLTEQGERAVGGAAFLDRTVRCERKHMRDQQGFFGCGRGFHIGAKEALGFVQLDDPPPFLVSPCLSIGRLRLPSCARRETRSLRELHAA